MPGRTCVITVPKFAVLDFRHFYINNCSPLIGDYVMRASHPLLVRHPMWGTVNKRLTKLRFMGHQSLIFKPRRFYTCYERWRDMKTQLHFLRYANPVTGRLRCLKVQGTHSALFAPLRTWLWFHSPEMRRIDLNYRKKVAWCFTFQVWRHEIESQSGFAWIPWTHLHPQRRAAEALGVWRT